MRRTQIALVVVLTAVACRAPSAQSVPASAASAAQVRHVSGFLKHGLKLAHAYAAKAQAHQNATFVAAQVVGQEDRQAVGVWLVSGAADVPGLTLSVNAVAKVYSDAPDCSQTRAEVSMLDPPAQALYDYVRARLE